MVLKDEQFRNKLCTEYGIHAVEMEGSGIADAATMKGLPFMIIRGICDYCDQSKNDNWHGYAAAVAAAYTKALIEVLKTDSKSSIDIINPSANMIRQKTFSGIEATGNIEVGDIKQTANSRTFIEQGAVTDVKTKKNIKIGDITQQGG